MSATGFSSPNFSYDEVEVPRPSAPPANEVPFDSEDEEDAWDEVDVTVDNSAAALAAAQTAKKDISVVISKGSKDKKKKKSDGSVTRDRMVRQQRHRAHATCQLATGLIRNGYLNDPLLQARLVSLVPLHLQNAFRTFSKQTHPSEAARVRLFDRALSDLLSWWFQSFEIADERGLKRRDVAEVEQELAAWSEVGTEAGSSKFPWEPRAESEKTDDTPRKMSAKSRGKAKEVEREWGPSQDNWEVVHGLPSMNKSATILKGSRDMSAQLFTCLCRALDIPARLVFSLQPVDWRAPSAMVKKGGKKKGGLTSDAGHTTDSDAGSKGKRGKASAATSGRESGAEAWEDGQGKLAYKVPQVNLRKPKQIKKPAERSPSPEPSEEHRPPVFWTEAWSRYSRKWITIDPYRKKYRCKSIMEPPRSMRENQLLYVVAFEEDFSARDVTPRYTKSYNNYTVKMRAPSKKGTDWFAELIRPFERSFELNRDREEKEELWKSVANEPFPTSIGGFKNHPNYVLEQHLHRDEVIREGSKQLGVFKGTDAVFRRSDVVQLKSTENFWREGRVIKDGEIPMKWVKSRVVTINRKRAEEFALQGGEEPTQQALYSQAQTEIYVPPPVKDGKIPRNNFGNIDLYVPSMLPEGAIHLASKQAAKVAKAREIDYADAITGFEFRQRRANPVITGIVVAADKANELIEAIIESEEAAEEKEFAKRQDRCLKRWKKLILGLRIRQRLQASYQDKSATVSEIDSDVPTKANGKRAAPDVEKEVAQPRKRSATKPKPTPPPARPKSPPRTRASVAPPAPPTPDSKRSTTGRSLRLNLSPKKLDAPAATPTTRASVAKAAGSAPPPPPPPPPVGASGTGSDSETSLEYESDF